MKKIYSRPECMTDASVAYCAGCSHGVSMQLIASVIDEMKLQEDVIFVGSVGCGPQMQFCLDIDYCFSEHGRAPATATGVKRMNPDKIVFTYQGDGDAGSIGIAELIHAAHRGEKMTVIMMNNTNYGMTGGQMAPTTLVGQQTATSPYGRDEATCGAPLHVAELLATINGAKFVERVAVNTPANIRKAKKAIQKAFTCQKQGLGFSFVEIVGVCPSNWHMTPVNAMKWMEENVLPVFPLGNFKNY